MASNINAVGNSLAGQTGSGAFVGSNSPTIITPAIAQINKVTTAGVGVQGSTNGVIPAAGNIGEVIQSIIPVSGGSLISTSTPTNMTHIDITAGNWLIMGNIFFNASGSNTCTAAIAAINTVSDTKPDSSKLALIEGTLVGDQGIVAPTQYVTLSSTITYYLVGQINFSTGSYGQSGQLIAIRMP